MILGYGIGGQLLAQSLAELSVPHVVLELNGATVRTALERGVNIHYADVSAHEPLEAAGVAHAAAVVVVIERSRTPPSARCGRCARSRRDVPIITRTRYRLEAERLTRRVRRSRLPKSSRRRSKCSRNCWSGCTSRQRRRDAGGQLSARGRGWHRPVSAGAKPVAVRPVAQGDRRCAGLQLPPPAGRVGGRPHAAGGRSAHFHRRHGAGCSARRRHHHLAARRFALAAGDDIFLLGDDSDVLLARTLLSDGPRQRRPPEPMRQARLTRFVSRIDGTRVKSAVNPVVNPVVLKEEAHVAVPSATVPAVRRQLRPRASGSRRAAVKQP